MQQCSRQDRKNCIFRSLHLQVSIQAIATFDLNISVILFVILAIVLSTVIPVGTSKKKK